MKFKEYPYEHLDEKFVESEYQNVEKALKEAKSYDAFYKAFQDLDVLNRKVETMSNLSSVRHTIQTNDAYYTQENDYFNELIPHVQNYRDSITKTIWNSPYFEELKKHVPPVYFLKKEFGMKAFDPSIIEELQQENKLASEYQALVASADIEFDGKHYSLEGLQVKMQDEDRETRKRATKAYWQWFEEHEQELGAIYDKMVKLRTQMAKKLGFDNYIPLGYLRMERLDYDQNDVANYRKQVLEDVVPFDNMLYEKQRQRLGYDQLQAWDEKIEFLDGNPTPKYDREEMVKRALKMYRELDPETGKFFEFMVEHDLLDLDSYPGKAAGGYCTFMPDFESPFIFANFNGTSHDAEVLTHEAGHAFQSYSSKENFPFECVWTTMESAEIHSMSMEFFTYPWMKSFFEDDVNKYYYSHLGGTLKFLPYGVLVDHFQHEVYAHPEMSHEERMATWRRLEKQYLPHKNYEEIPFLERGGWWMRQLHIFMDPFYYIDYTLAQVCALQFWTRMQKEDPKAFEDYKKICKLGGKLPFRQIVETANLKVPFEEGCLKDTVKEVEKWYENFDESTL
ncbi:M3 family oligoendopeptidase [Dubosiella newyorkensis]|uniref:M3 family oligoendopeptidase n=1 Tax=Dubosiella newyorkensis TaxID=1862672 RepID=UPI0023F43EC7|nr:M3 family oligoendopeptidase [Dubosiella newyorkensis]